MIRLYGHGNRSAANILKLRAALAEAGVDYEYVVVDLAKGEQRAPEYLALNPHGKVPLMVDDGFALPESEAILWYIAEKYPNALLVPRDVQGRARVRQWCDFASTSIYPHSYDLLAHTTNLEPAQRSAFVAERARGQLDRAVGVLEKQLTGAEFVAASAFSIADLGVAAVVNMARTRGQLTGAAYPAIAAHFARIGARPAWKRALCDTP